MRQSRPYTACPARDHSLNYYGLISPVCVCVCVCDTHCMISFSQRVCVCVLLVFETHYTISFNQRVCVRVYLCQCLTLIACIVSSHSITILVFVCLSVSHS